MKGGRSRAESKKADSKLSVKKGAEAAGKKPVKKGKPAKDPNMPKKPAGSFFVFMEEFRKTYKETHPFNKSVAAVGKAGGEKWKSLSVDEKCPYTAKAGKRRAEYEKNLQAYNKRMSDGAGAGAGAEEVEEESDKSRSEVNDDEDDDDAEGSEEEDEDNDDE